MLIYVREDTTQLDRFVACLNCQAVPQEAAAALLKTLNRQRYHIDLVEVHMHAYRERSETKIEWFYMWRDSSGEERRYHSDRFYSLSRLLQSINNLRMTIPRRR